MINRELVQLSHTYKDQAVAGMYMSSKLDGFRCIWDGGVSRGVPKAEVPWANNAKDTRYKETQIATGLWTRYGNVVHAPDWFLFALPSGIILDGELWSKDLSRQEIRSTCSPLSPDDRWKLVQFWAFNRLAPEVWLGEGRINNPNYSKLISGEALGFFLSSGGIPFGDFPNRAVLQNLQHILLESSSLRLVQQTILDSDEFVARAQVSTRLIQEMSRPRGEGLILLEPLSHTRMKRVKTSLKVKPRDDSEAEVIGYISGKGKLLGMMGALLCSWEGREFELSGFTEAERTLSERSWATANPGETLPEDILCPRFPIGTEVSFSYRGVTDGGLPNEGVYKR